MQHRHAEEFSGFVRRLLQNMPPSDIHLVGILQQEGLRSGIGVWKLAMPRNWTGTARHGGITRIGGIVINVLERVAFRRIGAQGPIEFAELVPKSRRDPGLRT